MYSTSYATFANETFPSGTVDIVAIALVKEGTTVILK
jgi:hypothetical protein